MTTSLPLMSTADAADVLKVDERTIRNLAAKGQIIAALLDGEWKISAAHVIGDWVTPADVADHFGVSREWIRRLCRNGRIDARKFGRSWRIERRTVDAMKISGLPDAT